jgi:hypothetical protein
LRRLQEHRRFRQLEPVSGFTFIFGTYLGMVAQSLAITNFGSGLETALPIWMFVGLLTVVALYAWFGVGWYNVAGVV